MTARSKPFGTARASLTLNCAPEPAAPGKASTIELATLEWVDWHNHRRLHSACHDLTPAEYELIHYRQHPALTEAGVSTN